MPKKSLASQITDIAKKNKISLKKDAVVRGAVDIRGPLSRPCGSGETAQNRYRLSDLQDLARASGVDSKQDMDTLCRVLGIKPHVDRVQVPVKSCNSKARGSDRYTRDDVVALARSRGMTVSGKTMDELCDALGIESSQVVHPSSPSLMRRSPLVIDQSMIEHNARLDAREKEEEEKERRLGIDRVSYAALSSQNGSYSPPSRRAKSPLPPPVSLSPPASPQSGKYDFDKLFKGFKSFGTPKDPVQSYPPPPVYTSLSRSSSNAFGNAPVQSMAPIPKTMSSLPIQLVNSSSSVFGKAPTPDLSSSSVLGMSRALGPGPNENAVTGQNPYVSQVGLDLNKFVQYNSQSPTSLSDYEEDFNFQPDISSSSSSSMVPLGQLRRSKRISVKNKVE